MPPRKRAATKPVSSSTGEVKRQGLSKPRYESEIVTADLTAQNAIQSPLLRLPAELRNEIWDSVYSNMMIGMRFDYNHHIDYYPVRPSRDEYTPRRDKHVRLPGFVCKQFWAEVLGIFLSSFTLRLDDPGIFRAMIASGSPLIPQVRSVFLISQAYCPASFVIAWAETLTPSVVGQLKNLQGLRLKLQTQNDPLGMWRTTDIMEDHHWEVLEFPAIIRNFQQRKLHEALTSVHIDHWVETDHRYRCPSTICEVICKNMLQHQS
ncbi:uncharacterized protein EKO05_0007877 [Ascochyta rabiei]|uniref:Uncharacterized protein n=1 Tax=Didymella rabiei TaxID=5454 RepID=A0A163BYK3_DIDRA|nr:uncharacterized protein EKO05_0007877 [Ascochyta rabiei]KZM22092.1 hypothetical protein ST47_g6781 [Ascochyta rabiei]UPX17528.1 hypothetical protein EKO05_0007877 [Ascochyta rabiei]